MANFQTHISVSAILGAGYGAAAQYYEPRLDWGQIFLGAGLTTLGGMLPDLDSDSGIPVRELFGLAGAITPVLLSPRLAQIRTMSAEQKLIVMVGVYLFVRYLVAELFKFATVHRGMMHSIPAMLICGFAVFVLYHHDEAKMRWFLACGVMIGFLSHLVLDELYAVDLMGLTPRLNKFAGSALKLTSEHWGATLLTYLILFVLGSIVWVQVQ